MVSRITADQLGDIRWRLNNLYYITDANGRHIPFKTNWAQESLLDEMWYLNVILKARQLGFTTLIQLYMLDQCVFNSNVQAGTIAHTREDAEDFFTKKVRYAYDNLPRGIRERNPAKQDSVRQLTFANDSSIRVGTSLRSGTYQFLHVSEYGKLCAKFPEKAREVRTGAFNTVHSGQVIWVESTAEGQAGGFFGMCQEAQRFQRMGTQLTPLDFKFHFYPWWKHPGYAIPETGVVITQELEEYFERLEDQHGIKLSPQQKAWYARKSAQQRGDMKREFPSTPDEAFEAAIEGAYFANEMAKVETEGRICDLPVATGVKVDTEWDLGMNDVMTIAFTQEVAGWKHYIDFYENSGFGLAHYAQVLQDKQRQRGFVYGEHYWPHDGNVRILDEKGRKRKEVMRDLGYHVYTVPRPQDLGDSIESVRNILVRCKFDRRHCDDLVRGLKSYRREWDEDTQTFKNRPMHDWASHRADCVRTGAEASRDWEYEADEYKHDHLSGRNEITGY